MSQNIVSRVFNIWRSSIGSRRKPPKGSAPNSDQIGQESVLTAPVEAENWIFEILPELRFDGFLMSMLYPSDEDDLVGRVDSHTAREERSIV